MDGKSPNSSRSPNSKSRVTTGRRLLANADGRSATAKRYRDLLDAYMLEFNVTTEAGQTLARRAAGLACWLEQQEAVLAEGGTVDIAVMTTSTNSLRRLLADLRKMRRR